ncbi:MAG: formate dehydrogenase accessory sulfurtransferase FdhD [Acidobacteriota bacterium]
MPMPRPKAGRPIATDIQQREVLRWREGSAPEPDRDDLAREEPLEVRVNGRPVSVTMRTPGRDRELALGFLLSEGMIFRRQDVVETRSDGRVARCNWIDIQLAPEAAPDFDRLTRHVFASSSCGVCGKATIQSVHQHFPPLHIEFQIEGGMLLQLPDRLRRAQSNFDRTGGLHAAAIFDAAGNLLVLREDVGRHNAVDKVLGWGLLEGYSPFEHHILMVSGRSSFEIMQKALAGRVPIVAAVSAPSSLAVQFAQESGQTLVGFLRESRMNIYSFPERIRFG